MRTIDSILIANRGEIALRIIRTCRRLGIRTVAVYSDADAPAPFVAAADEAVHLPGNAPGATYLDQDRILAAAQLTGADAIHPGYGFLAENAEFARRCAAAGITFIGPHPAAIARMGSKSEAKSIMQAHGVPVVPGYPGADQSLASLRAEAEKIGYPVLLKAVAGGGGKGMRIVEQPADLEAAIRAAKSEAQSAFGDGQMILEKYFPSVRHIEFQIFGDQHGQAIHLRERECTIQRRYQKILEESPSPALTPELRAEMGAAAVRAAQALQYDNAGTVEFILDERGQYYFLEVNTRLQVEHPVTELITGLDLVEWQIRIAQGEPLPLTQAEVPARGYAVECRLYAEDPTNNFLPATGTLLRWSLPKVDGLRVDSGVTRGSEISVWYDPMLAKLIVHGPDRTRALARMRYVLTKLFAPGLVTNQAFLLALVSHEKVRVGDYDTHFLRNHPILPPVEESQRHRAGLAVVLAGWWERKQHRTVLHSIPGGWRNSFFRPQRVDLEIDGEPLRIDYRAFPDYLEITINGASFRVEGVAREGDHLQFVREGRRITVALAQGGDGTWWTNQDGYLARVVEQPRFPVLNQRARSGGYRAPMPSQVLRVLVEAGAEVEAGQPLVVLSSMKMENTIVAAAAGTVATVLVEAGTQIAADTELLTFAEAEGVGQ
ncbi:MAG: biotin carboxylase N-terminal domain-containing protein [Bacteroidota bacterium]